MERREFVTALGAAAAAISVSQAFVNEGHAATEHMHPPKYKALMEASAKCVSTGNECLRHCFGMLSMNETSMADCTKASYRSGRRLRRVGSPGRGQFDLYAGLGENGRRCLHCLQEGMR